MPRAKAWTRRKIWWRMAGVYNNVPYRSMAPNYARGTLSAPGGLANVDEELVTKHFPELVVRPRQGRYTILDPGDGVVPRI